MKEKYPGQTEVDFIARLDKCIDDANQAWADEIADIIAHKQSMSSREYDVEINKVNKKYGDIVSECLILRDDLYQIGSKKQEKAFMEQFEERKRENAPKLDENGRPIGKKWVDGHWEDVDVK